MGATKKGGGALIALGASDDSHTYRDASWDSGVRAYSLISLAAFAGVALFYWKIIFGGSIPASDGQFAPFFERFQWWSDLAAGGWPPYADLNQMQLYPIRLLFPPTEGGFSLFVASAPWVFAIGVGFAARQIIGGWKAPALIAFLAAGLGFISAHLGHTSMIHTAAWLPWMMGFGAALGGNTPAMGRHMLALALATFLCWSAGHPQLAVYSPVVVIAGVLASMRWSWASIMRSAVTIGASSLAGVLLALAVIVPAMELGSGSERHQAGPEYVAQMALPAQAVGGLFTPFVAGGDWSEQGQAPFRVPGGTWEELVAPVGLILGMLAFIGACSRRRRKPAIAASMLFLVSISLASLPTAEWAARLLADVPVLGNFRNWGRWLAISNLAVAVLAAIGIEELIQKAEKGRLAVLAAISAAFLGVAAALGAWMAVGPNEILSLRPQVSVSAAQAIAAGVALALLAVAACVTSGRWRLPIVLGLPMLAAVELWLISSVTTWRFTVMASGASSETADARLVRDIVEDGGRFLSAAGWQSHGLSLERTRLASIPSVSWYGPLIQREFSEVTGVTNGGWTRPQAFAPHHQGLDLYGVRVAEVGTWLSSPEDALPLLSADSIRLGPGCNEANPRYFGELPLDGLGQTVRSVSLVSSLACGLAIPEGAAVASVETGSQGDPLIAGIHASEWALECLGAGQAVQHSKPEQLMTIATPSCNATAALSDWPMGEDGRAFALRYGAESGGLSVHGLILQIGEKWLFLPPNVAEGLTSGRWRWRGLTASGALVLNRDWLPRFRFVSKAVVVPRATQVAHIHGSREQRLFAARSTALLGEGDEQHEGDFAVPEIINVDALSGSEFLVQIAPVSSDALLVVGDNFSPHWQASSGDRPLTILRVNASQFGVVVPAGSAEVRLHLNDRFLRAGFPLIVFGAIVVLLGGLALSRRLFRSRA